MNSNKFLKFAVALLATATLLAPLQAQATPKAGQQLPGFSVTTPNGQLVTNQNYSGRVLLLVFSTEYCSACKHAIPAINRLASRYGKDGFYVLGLMSGNGIDSLDVKIYTQNYAVGYPMAPIEQQLATDRFGMLSAPYSLLINKKGVIAGIYYGYSEKILMQVEDQVKKLLVE